MKAIPKYASPSVQIDFTAEYIAAVRDCKAPNENMDRDGRLTDELLALNGVDEVCLNHCAWINYQPEIIDWDELPSLVEAMHKEILRWLKRYGRKL